MNEYYDFPDTISDRIFRILGNALRLAAYIYLGAHIFDVRSNDFSEYDINRVVNGEHVWFDESEWNSRRAYLDVTKQDGRKVKYVFYEDHSNNKLVLEEIAVTVSGNTTSLDLRVQNQRISDIAKEAEASSRGYLERILESKAAGYK